MSKLSELIQIEDTLVQCTHRMKDCPYLTDKIFCDFCIWSPDNKDNTKRVIKIIQKLED